MSFIDALFPIDISRGSRGGPEYATSKQVLGSGKVRRNSRWTYPLHKYDIGYGVKSQADVYEVLKFFHAARGEGHTFRFRDPFDNVSGDPGSTPASTDVMLLNGATGGETSVQLIKTYTVGSFTLTRKITLPVAGSVLIRKNAGLLTEGPDYTVNTANGQISFSLALTGGDVIEGGFQFDVPVYFDQAELPISTGNPVTAEIPAIMLIEDKTAND